MTGIIAIIDELAGAAVARRELALLRERLAVEQARLDPRERANRDRETRVWAAEARSFLRGLGEAA
jgi:hypothetical protein